MGPDKTTNTSQPWAQAELTPEQAKQVNARVLASPIRSSARNYRDSSSGDIFGGAPSPLHAVMAFAVMNILGED